MDNDNVLYYRSDMPEYSYIQNVHSQLTSWIAVKQCNIPVLLVFIYLLGAEGGFRYMYGPKYVVNGVVRIW